MQDLTISFIQEQLSWHDPSANRDRFSERIKTLPVTDLILLPEMFTTGFTLEAASQAEKMDGETVSWMQQMAHESRAVVAGSVVIEQDGACYNRLVWMRPDGTYQYYDKRHLFRMAKEHHHYADGQQRLVVEVNGWKVCPLICYDLRFPVWSRNSEQFHLLLYLANWPAARSHHWRSLLPARAIENQCYVAGVNRVGSDGNGISYCGDSTVINPQGEVLAAANDGADCYTCTLSYSELEHYRERFPAHLDADHFSIENH